MYEAQVHPGLSRQYYGGGLEDAWQIDACGSMLRLDVCCLGGKIKRWGEKFVVRFTGRCRVAVLCFWDRTSTTFQTPVCRNTGCRQTCNSRQHQRLQLGQFARSTRKDTPKSAISLLAYLSFFLVAEVQGRPVVVKYVEIYCREYINRQSALGVSVHLTEANENSSVPSARRAVL